MKKVGAALFVLSAFVTGWASDLSKEAAGQVINRSLQSTRVDLSLPLGRVGKKCADNREVSNFDPTQDIQFVAAQEAGILTVTPELDSPGLWRVDLKETKPAVAEALKKIPHHVANGCDYQELVLYIARKELVDVVSVKQSTDAAAEVQYTWKWAPSKPFANLAELLSPPHQKDLEAYLSRLALPQSDPYFRVTDVSQDAKPYTAKRTLKKSDDGWRVAFDQNIASEVIAAKLAHESKVFDVAIGKVGVHCAMMIGDKESDVNLDPENYISMTVLRKAGYVSVAPEEMGSWQVSLTARGQSGQGGVYERNTLEGCDFESIRFPLAKQFLVRIVAIRGDDDAPEVEYLWKWVPTDLGMSLRATGDVYAKLSWAERAALRKYLAQTDFSPALSLPLPSAQEANIPNRSKVRLTKYPAGWFWM